MNCRAVNIVSTDDLDALIFRRASIEHLRYVYTLRLIGPISYPGECDLMVQLRKYSVIFSRMHFVTVVRI